MKKVFIDTDIFMDVLTSREPHFNASAKLLSLVVDRKIAGFTSVIVFANLHYLYSKNTSREIARNSLVTLREYIEILPVDDAIIELALNSSFTDFEDAIQYYTAIKSEIPIIITRNIRDYRVANILVCNAREYLEDYFHNKE